MKTKLIQTRNLLKRLAAIPAKRWIKRNCHMIDAKGNKCGCALGLLGGTDTNQRATPEAAALCQIFEKADVGEAAGNGASGRRVWSINDGNMLLGTGKAFGGATPRARILAAIRYCIKKGVLSTRVEVPA